MPIEPVVLHLSTDRVALADRVTSTLLCPPGELAAADRFTSDGRGGSAAIAQSAQGGWGLIGHTGQWLISPDLQAARAFSEGFASVQRDGLCGYVTPHGEYAIEPRFRNAAAFHCGLAAVRADLPTRHYVDVLGRKAFDGEFCEAGAFSPVGLAPVRLTEDGPAGYVDRSGHLAIAPAFTRALPFSADGAAPVKSGGLWGLIGVDGTWILEPRYGKIEAFNADGLAYFDEPDHWNNGSGYLDSTGRVVLRGGQNLSRKMSCGAAQDDYLLFSFVGPGGFDGRFQWAETFTETGAVTALNEAGEWGVLRAGGTFSPVSYVEPLTDDEGWVLGFGTGHGVAPFIAADLSIAYLDTEARPVMRLVSDGQRQELLNPAGDTLWAAGPGPRHYRFLSRQAADYAEVDEDVLTVATRLAEAEPIRFAPFSVSFGCWTADEGLDEWDEEDIFEGALEYLASAYINDELNGAYQFLDSQVAEQIQLAFNGYAAQLGAAYGPPLPDVNGMRRGPDHEKTQSWRLPDGRLLTLETDVQYGDGDFEHVIWLVVRAQR